MISFIVPCYNAQETVQITVNSLLTQTIKDYEIILINDGSTDDTYNAICDIASRHNFIKIIDKENGGVSSARNAGLKIAKGDFIVFLDSDDLLMPNSVEVLSKYRDADIVLYGWTYEYGEGKYKICKPEESNKLLEDYLLGIQRVHISSICIRTQFLVSSGISFVEGTHYSEDVEFICKCFYYSTKFSFCPDVLFTYRWCPTSVMHVSQYTAKRITSVYALERVNKLLENSDYSDSALIRLKLTVCLHIRLYNKLKCNDKTIYEELCCYADKYLPMKTPFYMNKFSVYVFIMAKLYKMKSVFGLVISL